MKWPKWPVLIEMVIFCCFNRKIDVFFLLKMCFSKIFLSSSSVFMRYSRESSCSTRNGTFAAKWYLRFEFESASFATSEEISNRFSVGKFSFRWSKSVFGWNWPVSIRIWLEMTNFYRFRWKMTRFQRIPAIFGHFWSKMVILNIFLIEIIHI